MPKPWAGCQRIVQISAHRARRPGRPRGGPGRHGMSAARLPGRPEPCETGSSIAGGESMSTPMERAPDPGLGTAPIPKDRYTSARFAEREWERMWTRVWLMAGRASDPRTPGDYFTFEIGPESVLVIRQPDGSLARPLQRLHAPRQPAARAGSRPRRDLLVPVPRLEVRHRRQAARRCSIPSASPRAAKDSTCARCAARPGPASCS